jgi:hypothetical protein
MVLAKCTYTQNNIHHWSHGKDSSAQNDVDISYIELTKPSISSSTMGNYFLNLGAVKPHTCFTITRVSTVFLMMSPRKSPHNFLGVGDLQEVTSSWALTWTNQQRERKQMQHMQIWETYAQDSQLQISQNTVHARLRLERRGTMEEVDKWL